jgi:hypothetical protein
MSWGDAMEDGMAWDQIEFWETWHDVGCGETIREISEKEKLLYDKTRNELSAKHEKIKAATVEFEIGFIAEHSLILFLTHILKCSNSLWLALS